MYKRSFFWLLVAILLVACWGGYHIYRERKSEAPEKLPGAKGEETGMDRTENGAGGPPGAAWQLQYLGHSAFLLQAGETRFLMDPYDPSCGYGQLETEADYITVSHEHMDHNYIAAAPAAKAIRGLSPDGLGWEEVSLSLGGLEISTLPTYHDDAAGKLRGRNAIFIFEAEGLRLAHLGDLGHPLNPEQAEKLMPVDVLLLPVGGHFTIDATQAQELINGLSPSIVVPMHYRTEATRNWTLAPLADFLEGVGSTQVREIKDPVITLSTDMLPPEPEIWVMEASPPPRRG